MNAGPTGGPGKGRGGKPAGKGAGRAGGKGAGKGTGKPAGKGTGKPAGKGAGAPPAAGAGGAARPGHRGGKKAPARQPGRPGAAPRAGSRRPQPPATPPGPPVDVHDPEGVRLQKVLAQAGVGSRRACEDLIAAGRVTVDGHLVTELGVRVDAKRQAVHVDGMRIQLDESLVYLAANKPPGVLSSMTVDPEKPSLGDMVSNREERLFHVGRLDLDTEGLILLTNDGEVANRLAHPRYEVPKIYLVEVAGPVPRDLGRRLKEGIELDDGVAAVDEFKVVDQRPGKLLLELTLHDGRNRIVRRLLEAAGHPVLQLARIQVGPIRLGDLRSGRTRVLNKGEVASLMASVGL